MAYKDKDKQRAYQRDWVRHRRRQSLTSVEFVEPTNVEPSVEPDTFTGPLTKEKQLSRKGFND